MYDTNITVVSKMEGKSDKRIIYNRSFDRAKNLQGIVFDQRMYHLLAYHKKEKFMTTSLMDEGCEAWKHFMKNDQIDKALSYCRTSK